jgi:hypothetical protein
MKQYSNHESLNILAGIAAISISISKITLYCLAFCRFLACRKLNSK